MAHLHAKDDIASSIILPTALAFKKKRRYTILSRSLSLDIR